MNGAILTIIGFTVIFVTTTLGSAVVFMFKGEISPKANTVFLGFAAGIMVAASIWSLLLPALEGAEQDFGAWSFVPAAAGFLAGGLFLVLLDKAVPHLHKGTGVEEGPKSHVTKAFKLFLAVTIHNIPEGLAVGFAFGAAAAAGTDAAFLAALGLAIGIAVQNFPEGAAVSLPLKSATGSRSKAFLYGMGSGAVEPLFAVLGYFLAASIAALILLMVTVSDLGMIRLTLYLGVPPLMDLGCHTLQ